MPTQLSEGSAKRPSGVAGGDRRAHSRDSVPGLGRTRRVVVLRTDTVMGAELIEESSGGIAVRIPKMDASANVGDGIEVIYRGRRRTGEIRHITDGPEGVRLGVQWKKTYLV